MSNAEMIFTLVIFTSGMVGGAAGTWIGFMIYKKGLKNEQ